MWVGWGGVGVGRVGVGVGVWTLTRVCVFMRTPALVEATKIIDETAPTNQTACFTVRFVTTGFCFFPEL